MPESASVHSHFLCLLDGCPFKMNKHRFGGVVFVSCVGLVDLLNHALDELLLVQ